MNEGGVIIGHQRWFYEVFSEKYLLYSERCRSWRFLLYGRKKSGALLPCVTAPQIPLYPSTLTSLILKHSWSVAAALPHNFKYGNWEDWLCLSNPQRAVYVRSTICVRIHTVRTYLRLVTLSPHTSPYLHTIHIIMQAISSYSTVW
jgi:hypothetical protein